MAGRTAEVNSNVLLCKTLWDGNTTKGVRARVFNSAGTEVSGSPFTLTHRGSGHYSGSGWNPTVEGQYSVSYEIYTTVGFATADRAYEWDDEEIEVRSIDQDLATLLTRLGVPVSTIAGDIASVQADTNDIQAKIGTPVSTLAGDIAGVQADTNDIQSKIGTPAGASVSVDIAAIKAETASIQADTNDIQAKIGTPVSTLAGDIAGVQSDTNDIQARIGAPVGTLASDIAGVQADTDDIQSKIGTPAGASVSADIAAVKAETASIQSDTNDIQSKIGTPVTTLAGDIAGVQADTDDIQSKIGTPAGASVSADIAAVKAETASIQSDTNDIQSKIGTPVTTLAGDIAAVQADTDDIQAKIGSPVSTISGDIAAVQTKLGTPAGASVSVDIAAVKSDTSTLTSRLTATRAGYLDNLPNLDATVSSRATQASVDAIQNNTRFAMVVQSPLILPTSGSQVYKFFGRLYDDAGSPEDPDSNTINIRIETPGGSVVVATTPMTRTAVGAYEYPYTVNSTDPERPLVVFMEYAENSVPFQQVRTTEVQEFETKLDTLLSRLTATRAGYLDNLPNLDTTVSSRQSSATALSQYNALQADTDDIQAKIGSPVSTLAGDIAGVQADTDDIQSKIGSPVTTLAGDIAAVQTKLGTPAGASVSADIAAVKAETASIQTDTNDIQSKIGTPVSTLAGDIAGVQSDTDDIQSKIGSPASTLAGDIAAVKAETASIQSDTDDIQSKIGTPVTTLAGDIAAVKSTADTINSKIGTPVGASLSADVAAVKADTAAILDDTGTSGVVLSPAAEAQLVDAVWDELQAGHTAAGSFGKRLDVDVSTRQAESDALTRFNDLTSDIAGVQADTDDIQTKIGTPVSTVSADIAAVKAVADSTAADVTAIKVKTDQLTFTGSNVNANAQVVSDKTDYALSSASRAAVVDEVWDELLSAHTSPGSTGEALGSLTASTPTGIAAAVWDALVAPHNLPNTFGNYVQVIRQSALSTLAELNSPTYGLSQIFGAIGDSELAVIAEVNGNETKIDAIIPYVGSQTALLKSEIDQNQILIEALATQLTAAESSIIGEINVVETKVDAVAAQIGTIQNNTTVRFIVPERLVKPTSGTKTYQFHLRLYDETGHAEAPDSTPTIRIRRLDTGIDIVAGAAMTPDGVKVGAYYYNFSITSGTDEYQALVEATVIENGATRYVPAVTEITEFESDLNSIQAQLTSVQGTVTNTNLAVNSGVYGLAAIKTGQSQIIGEIDANELLLINIKARTDLIPNDPATLASVSAVNATVLTRPDINEIQTRLDLTRDYIVGPDNRNNTAIYDKIDFTPIMKTNDPRLNNLDATISSRSILDAASVWSYGTRELTSFSLPAASVKAIWDHLASQATVNGSLGKRVADMLDAQVSTRATASQVASALAGVAQESTVSSLAGLITSGDNQTQILVNAMQADVSAIQAKTTNLPSDPVSASVVTGGFSAQSIAIANLDLKATGIKSKTDNLPPDPAKETSVLARPTNPVLASDVRLTRLDVAVSTRGTVQAADLAPLATTAQLSSTQTALTSEINQNEAKLNTLQATVNLVKAKTDQITSDPATGSQLSTVEANILSEIDNVCGGGGGGATAAEIWTYPSRTITQDPQSFGPDISDLATKEDVEEITINTAFCRMSTTLNSSDETQEVIVWLEKNGAPFLSASNARIKVKSTEGALLWEANLASPNADGVFAFSMPFVPPAADRSYYIEMLINDGATDISGRSAFITVG
jgi:hypothetical protein